MRSKLIVLGASIFALAVPAAPAFAQSSADQSATNSAGSQASNSSVTNQGAVQSQSGGSGQAQELGQNSSTTQSASSSASAIQNGVNANVPVTVSGDGVSVGGQHYGSNVNGGGNSSATQDLNNSAESSASNGAVTNQGAVQAQDGSGGGGQAQGLEQSSSTDQSAHSSAHANQNGVNANVPVTIGGGHAYGGNSSAKQDLSNSAKSKASNDAKTNQGALQLQDGSGGGGQAQGLEQGSSTKQDADSSAHAYQNGVNANVPVSIGGDDVRGGNSSATQDLNNSAESKASNDAKTNQGAEQSQDGSGGGGQAQGLEQGSSTEQDADASAHAYQNGVNANVPVSIGGDDVDGGNSSAEQNNHNSAESKASNDAKTNQGAEQSQSSETSCKKVCASGGQAQGLEQWSNTEQDADSEANAYQNGVNANAPVSIGGDDVDGGNSSAEQNLSNNADSKATNDAKTNQYAGQSQESSTHCYLVCASGGQAQYLGQKSNTEQDADSEANARQDGVNANVPVSIGGDDVDGGNSSAEQNNHNSAESKASNDAKTNQGAEQSQSSETSCKKVCASGGQAQGLEQWSNTEQDADSEANAYQNGVNANAPVSIGGDDVDGGNSSAEQNLSNNADSKATNDAKTNQYAGQSQESSTHCYLVCASGGQAQYLGQKSNTEQDADSEANARQDGVNANVPVSIGGDDVDGGNSSAEQNNHNSAESKASNDAKTNQGAEQSQSSETSCKKVCASGGQAQGLEQWSNTEQDADSEANAYQNGVNANAPVSIGGDDVDGGNSSAEQNLSNNADSKATNDAKTNQYAGQSQESDSGGSQAQYLGQKSSTKQSARSKADAKQSGTNANSPVTVGSGKKHGTKCKAKKCRGKKSHGKKAHR